MELGYLGIQTIKVSTSLFQLFQQARLIPSVTELWQRHSKDLLAQPDATELSLEEQQHWRAYLAHLFAPWVKPQKLLFKSMLPGNSRLVMALPNNVFLLDANLLGINNVHQLLEASGNRPCRCVACKAPWPSTWTLCDKFNPSSFSQHRFLRPSIYCHYGAQSGVKACILCICRFCKPN